MLRLAMAETYTSGVWIVKPGEEDAFIQAWTEFVTWGSSMPGSGEFRLVRDLDQPGRYSSFAPWESFDAQQAWKEHPEFRERIMRVRGHCEDFQPSTYELVTQVA
jgi:heme-degrading monooxygenase HmoA